MGQTYWNKGQLIGDTPQGWSSPMAKQKYEKEYLSRSYLIRDFKA